MRLWDFVVIDFRTLIGLALLVLVIAFYLLSSGLNFVDKIVASTRNYTVPDSEFCNNLQTRDSGILTLSKDFIKRNNLKCGTDTFSFDCPMPINDEQSAYGFGVVKCKPGSSVGENVNWLYCKPTPYVSPFSKTLFAPDGTILGTETYVIASVVINEQGAKVSCIINH